MDIQKTMEFILEQNAATAARLEKLSESQDRLERAVEAHEADLETHTEWLTGLSRAMQEMSGQMKDGFATVAVAQKTTEENLNILIRTVQDMLPRIPPQNPTA